MFIKFILNKPYKHIIRGDDKMIIDSHVHIGNEKECEKTIKTSKYKDIYKINK